MVLLRTIKAGEGFICEKRTVHRLYIRVSFILLLPSGLKQGSRSR